MHDVHIISLYPSHQSDQYHQHHIVPTWYPTYITTYHINTIMVPNPYHNISYFTGVVPNPYYDISYLYWRATQPILYNIITMHANMCM